MGGVVRIEGLDNDAHLPTRREIGRNLFSKLPLKEPGRLRPA